MTIKDQVEKWIEDRLYILPYKDPENRIFTYGNWLPPEEIEIYKKIIDKYKEEFPNMIIIANNYGFQPIIIWDKNDTRKFVEIARSENWEAEDRNILRKCIFEIFILKKKITSFQERDDFLREKRNENKALLTQIIKSPDFIGEIKKFVVDMLEEIKGTGFGRGISIGALEKERDVLNNRLILFKSLYHKCDGIKRSHKIN